MEVILLDMVENLGSIGDRVKVKPGYARNFLLPQGKAALATEANIAVVEARRAEFEKMAADELVQAQGRAREIEKLALTLTANVGPEGKLFGSVGPADIADACEQAGVHVERSEVRMADGPIRVVGEHPVTIHLHTDVEVELMISVTGDEQAIIDEPPADEPTAADEDD